MVCNGLYVHSFVNTDYNRNALLRKAGYPVERTFVDMIAIISFTLNIIAIIAVMIFIVHTAKVHNRIYDIIDKMNRTIDDISIHLSIIKQNDDSLKEVHDKLNICTNGITELMSKQRYINKAIDQVGNRVVSIIAEYNQQIKAKISSVLTEPDNSSYTNKNRNTKLKTANTNNSNKNNKRKDK